MEVVGVPRPAHLLPLLENTYISYPWAACLSCIPGRCGEREDKVSLLAAERFPKISNRYIAVKNERLLVAESCHQKKANKSY